ncbi:HDOD domain-containing protein [Fundidesulfovibrio putealis]|uniref:HDOD domain-containing protein n=1 Tax=Fundidesulfovibrio putealis TaxID=270496 RepID=UPI0004098E1C|nr:HDOD domain-containing protein [Fundidesulfovibrio putealis]
MWDNLAAMIGLKGLVLAVKNALDRLAASRQPNTGELSLDSVEWGDMSLKDVDAGHSDLWAEYFHGEGAAIVARQGLEEQVQAWRTGLKERLEILFSATPQFGGADAPPSHVVPPALLKLLARRNNTFKDFETGYATLASLGDPNIRLSELSHIITENKHLTAMLLKCVNSPYFGLRGEVSSIPTAILILGLVNLRNVVYRDHMVKLVDIEDPRLKQFFNQVWEHLTFTSVCCSHVARAFDEVNPTTLFTMGLLHDIGRFVIATSPLVDRDEDQTLAYDLCFSIEDENDLFGINHAEAGRLVAGQLRFPPRIAMAVEHHHAAAWTDRSALGLDLSAQKYLAALFLADKLAGVFSCGAEEPVDPLHVSFHSLVDRQRLEKIVLHPSLARDIKKAQEMALRNFDAPG